MNLMIGKKWYLRNRNYAIFMFASFGLFFGMGLLWLINWYYLANHDAESVAQVWYEECKNDPDGHRFYHPCYNGPVITQNATRMRCIGMRKKLWLKTNVIEV